jgi:hypothetical protein
MQGAIIDPETEMVATKLVEMFCESIPGEERQAVARQYFA